MARVRYCRCRTTLVAVIAALTAVATSHASNALFTPRTLVVEPTALSQPSRHGVAAADLNGDGLADLVVSNEPNGQVTVLLGNGNATFRSPRILQAAGAPYLADLNNDGKTDVVLESPTRREIAVFLNSGDATFSSPILISNIATFPGPIALFDLNKDNNIDILVPDGDSRVPQNAKMSVLLGNGDGTFRGAAPVSLANAAFGAFSVRLSDLSRDGKVDAVAGLTENGFAILKGNGDATFGRAQQVYVGQVFSLGLADLNGDEIPDLLIGLPNGIRVTLGVGDDTFVLFPDYRVTVGSPIAIDVADVNADNRADVLFISYDLDAFGVALGDGTGHFSQAVTFSAGEKPTNFAIADFNNDGVADVVVAGSDQQTVTIFLNSTPAPAQVPMLNNVVLLALAAGLVIVALWVCR